MSEILVDIKDLKKDYVNGDVITSVLKGVSLQVKRGEFVAIMGPSGSGKSTLMHIMSFLDRPTSGSYHFDGLDTTTFDDEALATLRNEKIGFVFQAFNLLARTTVLDNVKLPLQYGVHDNHDARARAALESVGLGHRLNFFTNQISGGEKQRVAIARALVCDPSVIFADEPTGNLDSKSGGIVMGILQKLSDEGKTVVLVTHETDTAEHAGRIIRVKDGVIVGDERVTNRRRADPGTELAK